jgi:hypothetical protein
VFAAPFMGAQAWAADENPIAGMKEAKVAFDITAGEPGRMLNILNTIDETREGLVKHGVSPRFVLAFRGPASLLTQTDLFAAEARRPRDCRQGGRQAQAAARHRRHRADGSVQHRMRGQKVDKAR